MSTSTAEITDFLLARISEDERDGCPCRFVDEERDACDRRVLDECAAKRRIVEAWIYLDADPELRMQAWTLPLVALAAVYADHPDYNQEWRG